MKSCQEFGKDQLKKLRLDFKNSFGWSTDRKFIVIESDDWGSIRTSSREAYHKMLLCGDRIDQDPFTRLDALECDDDLMFLLDILSKYKDRSGNKPVLTAYCAVANPDFEKIRETNFETYCWEPFTETLKRYPHHGHAIELWRQGIRQQLFYPQLHCREHLDFTRWMNDLRGGDRDLTLAFDQGMISGGSAFSTDNPYGYMDAFHGCNPESRELFSGIISDACEIFEEIFGYRSRSFTACCYVWTEILEEILKKNGVDLLQGSWYQFYPCTKDGKYRKMRHQTGDCNKQNQLYTVRNCFFEPAISKSGESVQKCLDQISSAFQRHKPAVISSHRLNYIGFIDEKNRDKNLILLDQLLKEIMNQWPDSEFITSVQLGEYMNGNG